MGKLNATILLRSDTSTNWLDANPILAMGEADYKTDTHKLKIRGQIMYKILHNNQIIDVMEDVRYVKCLPKSQKLIAVDKAQANAVVSSDGDTIYHILGTKNTFNTKKLSVQIIEITEEEYKELTTQIKKQEDLNNRINELEKLVQELYNKIK